jgi:hypothetical protein
MRNYALQKSPCNFLNLHTSPWEIPFLLLLCFSFLSALLLSGALSVSPHRRHLSLWPHPYLHPGPPSLSSTRLGTRRRAGGGAVGGAARAEQARARAGVRASARAALERWHWRRAARLQAGGPKRLGRRGQARLAWASGESAGGGCWRGARGHWRSAQERGCAWRRRSAQMRGARKLAALEQAARASGGA